MDTVDVDGLRIAYERAGAGPPLVLLHGYVGDGPTTWGRQLDTLCDDYTVVAWDAPGAGGSSDPPESFGMAGYAECLAGLVAALGIESAHVAGLSFGGALALELSRRHAAIPMSLVLADLRPDEFVDALLPSMFSDGTAPEVVDAFRLSMLGVRPGGFRAMARASAEDLRDALPGVAVPTLLVYGDRDVRAPLTVGEALHAAISASKLVVLRGAGHVCNVESPDEFDEAVRDFLHRR